MPWPPRCQGQCLRAKRRPGRGWAPTTRRNRQGSSRRRLGRLSLPQTQPRPWPAPKQSSVTQKERRVGLATQGHGAEAPLTDTSTVAPWPCLPQTRPPHQGCYCPGSSRALPTWASCTRDPCVFLTPSESMGVTTVPLHSHTPPRASPPPSAGPCPPLQSVQLRAFTGNHCDESTYAEPLGSSPGRGSLGHPTRAQG